MNKYNIIYNMFVYLLFIYICVYMYMFVHPFFGENRFPNGFSGLFPGTSHHQVDAELGAGFDAHATWYGMVIEEIDDEPGQDENLQPGPTSWLVNQPPLRYPVQKEGFHKALFLGGDVKGGGYVD